MGRRGITSMTEDLRAQAEQAMSKLNIGTIYNLGQFLGCKQTMGVYALGFLHPTGNERLLSPSAFLNGHIEVVEADKNKFIQTITLNKEWEEL